MNNHHKTYANPDQNLDEYNILPAVLIESFQSGILIEDLTRRIVLANKKFYTMFGLNTREHGILRKGGQMEIEPTKVLEIASDRIVAHTARTAGDKNVSEMDVLYLKDGRTIEKESCPLMVDGRHLGYLSQFRDISDRVSSERQRIQAQKLQGVGTLAGGIAHDYNNLLGIMMGNASLAQTHLPVGHPAAQNIEKSISAMERAAELTSQILAYAGKGKFQFRTIEMAEEILKLIDRLPASLTKNLRLLAHLPCAPVYVEGDPGQIGQIIMNLIVNGIEAIGSKPGVISVTLSAVTLNNDDLIPYSQYTQALLKEGCFAFLEVRDSGCGIIKESVTKIFDPFFTTKFTGRGLGLSAVLGIGQGHNGGIMVDSNEGEGAIFRIIFPLAAPVIPAN